MIHSIFGTVYAKGKDFVVVSSELGLRYKVFVPASCLDKAERGGTVDLLVYIHRDQNGNETCFGFGNDDQQHLFLDLTSISGVGPKTAISILGFSLDLVVQNIVKQNYRFFKAVKGVGEKTAKSIVLELRRKYVDKDGA